jgi:hypothetical protein
VEVALKGIRGHGKRVKIEDANEESRGLGKRDGEIHKRKWKRKNS